MHTWNVTPQQALLIQERLRKKVLLEKNFDRIKTVAGGDVSFRDNEVTAAVVVFDYERLDVVEESVVRSSCSFPYIPGLLTFREGPPLLEALRRLRFQPDVMIFDGQGIAHPRGIGIASHLGVLLNRPAIGCAKSRLIGEYAEPAVSKGSLSPLTVQGETVGTVARTREGVRPVFVSPGHLIDCATATEIVLNCCTRFRLPEPTRWAHRRAHLCAKKSTLQHNKERATTNGAFRG